MEKTPAFNEFTARMLNFQRRANWISNVHGRADCVSNIQFSQETTRHQPKQRLFMLPCLHALHGKACARALCLPYPVWPGASSWTGDAGTVQSWREGVVRLWPRESETQTRTTYSYIDTCTVQKAFVELVCFQIQNGGSKKVTSRT
jgi:hypothetical protein